MVDFVQTNFGGGEQSPRMRSFLDSEVWATGVPTLENAILSRYGRPFKRPGTRYVATLSGPARIINLSIDGVGSFNVLFSQNLVEVRDTSGNVIASFATNYTEAQCFELQAAQSETALYVAHELESPNVLGYSRAGSSWSWTALDLSTLGTSIVGSRKTIGLSFDGQLPTDHILATENYFQPNDVNKIWRVDRNWTRVTSYDSATQMGMEPLAFAPPTPPNIAMVTAPTTDWAGPWEPGPVQNVALTSQTSAGTGTFCFLEAQGGGNIWNESQVGSIVDVSGVGNVFVWIRSVLGPNANGDSPTAECLVIRNNVLAGQQGVQYVVYGLNERDTQTAALTVEDATGTSQCFANEPFFTVAHEGTTINNFQGGAFTIDNVLSPTRAVVTVTSALNSPIAFVVHTTTDWTQQLNVATGFPRVVGFHQDRLVLAGPTLVPNRVFLSKTGDYDNFTTGDLDSDALEFTIASGDSSKIQWVDSPGDLIIGTDTGEYKLSGSPLTPSSLGVSRQTTSGGKSHVPVSVSGATLFISRSGKSLHEQRFSFNEDRYLNQDLTDAADHLWASPMREIVHFREPEEMVIAICEDRSVRCLTYRRANGVVAWSPWPGISAWSASVTPGTDQDQLWFVVQRGNSVHLEVVELDSPVTMDSYISVTPSQTPTGLDHLEGETVQAYADGAYVGNFVVESGGVTPSLSAAPSTTLYFGLQSTFRMAPRDPEVVQGTNASAGLKKTVKELRVLLNESSQGRLEMGTHQQPIQRLAQLDAPTAPFTGWHSFSGLSGSGQDLLLVHDTPEPFEVMSIVTVFSTGI